MLKFIRINKNFTPNYSVSKLEWIGEEFTFEKDNGIYYYRLKQCKDNPELTFVSFGFKGPDQWWSSNSSTINELFGIDCTECSVKELKGEYPDTSFATAILRSCIILPDNLEWGFNWGFKNILPKEGVEFPRRKDYFTSTHLDEKGELILPEVSI